MVERNIGAVPVLHNGKLVGDPFSENAKTSCGV